MIANYLLLELLRLPTTLPTLHLPLLSFNRKVRGRTVGPTLLFFTRPTFGFAADHDLIYYFGVILFAGVDGLLHILQALGARTDFDGLGLLCWSITRAWCFPLTRCRPDAAIVFGGDA